LYERALARKLQLESGAVAYKAIDSGYCDDEVTNCIHALSTLAAGAPRLHIATPGWGDAASYFITLSLTPWIVDSCRTHDWLLDRLGLTDPCLVRRDLQRNPAQSLLVRGVQAVTQRNVGKR